MTDLRTALLARCDELEKLAKAASRTRPGETWHVGEFLGEPAVTAASWAPEEGDPMVIADVSGVAEVATLIATFGPAAVLDMVAAAREMCEIHVPVLDMAVALFGERREVCTVCRTPDQWREGQNWGERRVPWPCPSLRATARMLGVAVTGG